MDHSPINPPIRLARLRLLARDISAQREFYEDVLGLPLVADTKRSLTFRSNGGSATEIEFVEANSDQTRYGVPEHQSQPTHGVPDHQRPYYHFAFNIPENQINDALEWTRARVPIIVNRDGREIVHFESWNAHSIYFLDPAGNIVEFIARHALSNATAKRFGPDSIFEASEIGLVVPDVASATAQLQQDLGAKPYRTPSDEFASIGDERGLFIIVRTGRKWFMAEHLAAEPFETGITLGGGGGRSCAMAGLPYKIGSDW